MYAKIHGEMHAEMHAEMFATHEERGISNRAKCSARSTEIHVKMHAEMQFRANSLFLSFSPLFLYRVRAAEVSQGSKVGGVYQQGGGVPPPHYSEFILFLAKHDEIHAKMLA